MYDTINYPNNPHVLLPNAELQRRWRERLADERPTYSAARYVDLPSAEKRVARGEFMAFKTGPYATRVAMLTEFDAIADAVADEFPTVVEAFGDDEPIEFGRFHLNR